jgi:hypothetical protein
MYGGWPNIWGFPSGGGAQGGGGNTRVLYLQYGGICGKYYKHYVII